MVNPDVPDTLIWQRVPNGGAFIKGLGSRGNVLAKSPDGHADLDQLKREVEAFTSHEDPRERISSALDNTDILQSGLVVPGGGGLRITDAGREKAAERTHFHDLTIATI